MPPKSISGSIKPISPYKIRRKLSYIKSILLVFVYLFIIFFHQVLLLNWVRQLNHSNELISSRIGMMPLLVYLQINVQLNIRSMLIQFLYNSLWICWDAHMSRTRRTMYSLGTSGSCLENRFFNSISLRKP